VPPVSVRCRPEAWQPKVATLLDGGKAGVLFCMFHARLWQTTTEKEKNNRQTSNGTDKQATCL